MQNAPRLGAVFLLLLLYSVGFSQQLRLGNNPFTVEKSAVLELQSSNQGLLFPRITDTVPINMLTPPDGMVIYFIPLRQLLLRSSGGWRIIQQGTSTITNWLLTGNAGTTPATHFLGTTDNQPLVIRTNNIERARFTTTGFLGIGTNAPAGRLHLVSDNNEFGNDYIFDDYGSTVTQGFYIRKARGTIASPANVSNGDGLGMIRFSGRTGGVFGFTAGSGMDAYYKGSGTNDLTDLRFFTSNTERMRIDENGRVAVGATVFDGANPEQLLVDAGTSASSVNVISGKGTLNNYLQLNIQNRSPGEFASSDLVATANNGTESINFVDLGINSSAFNNPAFPIISGANNAYLYSTGNDFVIGNGTSNRYLSFFTGGFAIANERMRIDGLGNVGIGTTTTTPSTRLHIRTGTANDGGLRLENLTSASPVTTGTGVLGVDATGKVVRAKTPLYYSGTGTAANTEDVTKIWIAEIANNSSGTPSVTIPSNVGFANILSIQVTAKGGASLPFAPIVSVTSNTLTSITLRLMESRVVIIANESLEPHTDTNTRIYIRVEGN